MNNVKRGVLRGVAFAAVAALISQAHGQSQVLTGVTITSMSTYGTYASFRYTPAATSPVAGCDSTSLALSAAVIDWSTDANAKAMYASALAAYISGKPLVFAVSGCFAYPNNGRVPLVYRVDVN